jgi:hypothetical protein
MNPIAVIMVPPVSSSCFDIAQGGQLPSFMFLNKAKQSKTGSE